MEPIKQESDLPAPDRADKTELPDEQLEDRIAERLKAAGLPAGLRRIFSGHIRFSGVTSHTNPKP